MGREGHENAQGDPPAVDCAPPSNAEDSKVGCWAASRTCEGWGVQSRSVSTAVAERGDDLWTELATEQGSRVTDLEGAVTAMFAAVASGVLWCAVVWCGLEEDTK